MGNEKLYALYKKLVSIKSDSHSRYEKDIETFASGYLKALPYFKENIGLTGLFPIENDLYERGVVWALVKGTGDNTLVIMHHHDAVEIADYGELMPYAYDIEALPEKLRALALDEEARKDLESGEWIFGRGSCDMKCGMALHFDLLEKYSNCAEKPGNLLLVSVPDEECFSAGMRGAVKLLLDLKKRYHLDYKLIHDSECHEKTLDGKGMMSKGSIGKMLPVVLAQGKQAHVAYAFDGLNPVGLFSQLVVDTDLNPVLCDKSGDEMTMPPAWIYMRDKKEVYDISMPHRVCGYLNMNTLDKTAADVVELVKGIAQKSFKTYLENRSKNYSAYKAALNNPQSSATLKPFSEIVYTFGELCAYAKDKKKERFESFFNEIYAETEKKINDSQLDYMEATSYLICKVLDFAEIHDPAIIISLSPPYYPPATSAKITGKETVVERLVEKITNYIKEKYGKEYTSEQYLAGVCDLSYAAMNKDAGRELEKIKGNMPLWGKCYDIDFVGIQELNIPMLNLGPWGKGFHEYVERVNKTEFLEQFPDIYWFLLQEVFK